VSCFGIQVEEALAGTRGTDSWLDGTDIDKKLVPICLYCLKCRKFSQLILSRIIETVASRRQILRPKCTKFDFGWGSAPDPAGGSLQCSPRPISRRPPVNDDVNGTADEQAARAACRLSIG